MHAEFGTFGLAQCDTDCMHAGFVTSECVGSLCVGAPGDCIALVELITTELEKERITPACPSCSNIPVIHRPSHPCPSGLNWLVPFHMFYSLHSQAENFSCVLPPKHKFLLDRTLIINLHITGQYTCQQVV